MLKYSGRRLSMLEFGKDEEGHPRSGEAVASEFFTHDTNVLTGGSPSALPSQAARSSTNTVSKSEGSPV